MNTGIRHESTEAGVYFGSACVLGFRVRRCAPRRNDIPF